MEIQKLTVKQQQQQSKFRVFFSEANTVKSNYIPYAYEEQQHGQIQLIISTGCSY